MPRIAPLEPPLDPGSAAALEALGPPIGLFRLLARRPERAHAIQGWGRYCLSRQAALSLRHRELAIDRTTALCGAEYEWGLHIDTFGDKAGLTTAEIRSLATGDADDDCWADSADRAILRAVDSLHFANDLDDATWAALHDALGDEGVIDLLLLCGWYHAISYLVRAARLQPEPGSTRFPAAQTPAHERRVPMGEPQPADTGPVSGASRGEPRATRLLGCETPKSGTSGLWLGSRVDADARLALLTLEHARALERFERANRAFFAAHVGDRGDDFFEHFDERLAARVDENREGTCLFFVVVDTGGEVLGRVNLSDIDQPELTELGYRVAEHAQGRGIATQGVLAALDIAATRGVKSVKARVSAANLVSRRVLERCGFGQTGPAESPNGSSDPFVGYRKDLVASCSPGTEPS